MGNCPASGKELTRQARALVLRVYDPSARLKASSTVPTQSGQSGIDHTVTQQFVEQTVTTHKPNQAYASNDGIALMRHDMKRLVIPGVGITKVRTAGAEGRSPALGVEDLRPQVAYSGEPTR
jgi:hypothetical protein